MKLSRREFLKLAGLSATGSMFATGWHFNDVQPTGYGRLFAPTYLHHFPTIDAISNHLLWPNSIHAITDVVGQWVRIDGGYVPQHTIQPMFEANQLTPTVIEQPTWVEVITPSACIRAYADMFASPTKTIEHGGLLEVVSSLCDDYGDWWVQSRYGWLQARHVQFVDRMSAQVDSLHLVIDRTHHQLIAVLGDEAVRLAACFPKHDISTKSLTPMSLRDDVLWGVKLDDGSVICGNNTHNQFGAGRIATNGYIEVSIVAARCLYRYVQSARTIEIS